MIRFAQAQDLPSIIRLWDQCFPDDGGFNAYFFEKLFTLERTLVLIEQETLCAMLQMLPYRLCTAGASEEVTYIYGACTAPDMRKRGYMAQLLKHSFALDKKIGRVASVLIPQEEWLFDFYRKFGYEPSFFVEDTLYTPEMTDHAAAELHVMTALDIPVFSSFFGTQMCGLPCAILRSNDQWREQLDMFASLGGNAFALWEGTKLCAYAFVWQTNGAIWVQELLSDSMKNEQALCAALCHRLGTQSLRITKSGTSRALGCAKFYDNRPAPQGYINLMFN